MPKKEISFSASGAVFQIKINGGIIDFTFISEGSMTLFSLSPDSIYKDVNSLFNIIHSNDVWSVRKALIKSEKSLESYFFKFRVIQPDKKIKWIRTNIIPGEKANEGLIFNGTFMDITEAENTNEELIQSEEKYRSLVENASDIILQIDKAGIIDFINYTLPPMKKEEVIGSSVFDYIPKNEIDLVSDTIHKVFKKGEFLINEIYLDFPDSPKWFLYRVNPIWLKNKVIGATIIATDITEDKKIKEEIKSKKDEFQTLLNNIPDIVTRFDKNLKYVYVNKATEEITGIDASDFIGKTYLEMGFEKSFSEAQYQRLKTIFKTGKKTSFESEVKTSDKVIYFSSIMVPEKDANGEVQFVLNIARDITEIKLAEKELVQKNEELVMLNTELDRFVYSASHDIRSPLTSILGLLNLAKHVTKVEDMADYHKMMEASILRLDDVVKDIIDYSKNSRLEVLIEKVDTEKLINETINFFKYSEEGKKVNFKTEINLQGRALIDSRRVKMILNNLVSNAVKYSDLSKEISFVNIAVNSTKDFLVFTVEDNGIGIEEEHLDKIFQMFYQATTKSTGAGLGMFIVKETVTKLQGKIEVDSEPGKGTTFRVELPKLEKIS